MNIIQATREYLDAVSDLFDGYRQFYGQAPDPVGARAFIEQRLTQADSVIFLACDEHGGALGFVQLYPSFSSVAMKKMWYLNDVYVSPAARAQGVATALLQAVQQHAKDTDALTVKLATAVDNSAAKRLYESLGYVKVTAFEHFTQRVSSI